MCKPAVSLCCAVSVALLLLAGPAPPAAAQAQGDEKIPLFLANEQTTVGGIGFAFEDSRTFDDDVLRRQIATSAPGFMDRVKGFLPFLSPGVYPLDRIELQKDVVRLRRFYNRQGFPAPWIDYGASELDTTANTLRIVFSVREGRPLIIQDVNFYAPDGRYATTLFADEERRQWIRFRDRTSFKTGDRFTDFDLVRIQDQLLSWLKDRGYAFARFDSTDTQIDSTSFTADISFYINPGPVGYFSVVEIEGNRNVTRQTILRELPFSLGDRFSNSRLVEGQRELFGLNLFRVALADVPPVQQDTLQPLQPGYQWRDSTVTVRFRVGEARLRYLTAQTGYSSEVGVTLQGQWSHRNFLGEARNLTVGSVLNTGVLASTSASQADPPLLLRGSVALRQPYLFTTRMSLVVEPFAQVERDPLLPDGIGALKINRRELGASTLLIYELLTFRTLSLRYTISQALQPTIQLTDTTRRDVYSKSILTLNGTFGKVNNFLNPRRGFLVRPLLEQAGSLGGLLTPGVEYVKGSVEIVGYVPLTRRVSVGARLTGGRLQPFGQSRRQFEVPFENRFDPVRFYAGGPSDVRGWDLGLIGPKLNRTTLDLDETTGAARIDSTTGLPVTLFEQYEPVGGLAKLSGNVEVRLPFPGLNDKWRSAIFLDFGQVSARSFADSLRADGDAPQPGETCLKPNRICLRDDGHLALKRFKFGVGAGIRYETPVGYVRFDLAFKINPDDLDLQSPRNAFLFEEGFLDEPRTKFINRFNFHLSLGQAF